MIYVVLVLQLVSIAIAALDIFDQRQIMSHFGIQYDALIAALKTNTDAVAARLDRFIAAAQAQAANGDPLTDNQFDELSRLADHLKAMGSDERDPVPALKPPPAPPESAPAPVTEPGPAAEPSVAQAGDPLTESEAAALAAGNLASGDPAKDAPATDPESPPTA